MQGFYFQHSGTQYYDQLYYYSCVQLSWESAGLLSGSSWVWIPAGPTPSVLKQLRRKCCLCHDICKWLDFQVFSDKDDKPEAPSHKPCSRITLWDVKELTHYLKRVGDIVPGVVVYLRHLHHHSSCVGRAQWAHKCTDSGYHRHLKYADVRVHRKKQCKEDTHVCPLNHDITYMYIHFLLL